MRLLARLLLSLQTLNALPGVPAAQPSTIRQPAYVPERVYDRTAQAFSDFEAMLAHLARADVILVGEQHDDPNTHRLEARDPRGAATARRGRHAVTRDVRADVQRCARRIPGRPDGSRGVPEVVSPVAAVRDGLSTARRDREGAWLAGGRGERAAQARVGRRKERHGRASTPRRPKSEHPSRANCSARRTCTSIASRRAWPAIPAPGSEKLSPPSERRATTERYYFSQCVKDETMAEAIAAAVDRPRATRRARQRRVPQRLRPGHRRARATPPRGPPRRRRVDPSGEEHRHRRAERRGSEPRGLSRLHRQGEVHLILCSGISAIT